MVDTIPESAIGMNVQSPRAPSPALVLITLQMAPTQEVAPDQNCMWSAQAM